eukprot:g364.t1
MNILFILAFLSAIGATTSSLCRVKRDASYAGFAQCSNDMAAYEAFFRKNFPECTAVIGAIQDPKHVCELKRKEANMHFAHLSQDMDLFERMFAEKHPECSGNHRRPKATRAVSKQTSKRQTKGGHAVKNNALTCQEKRLTFMRPYQNTFINQPHNDSGDALSASKAFYDQYTVAKERTPPRATQLVKHPFVAFIWFLPKHRFATHVSVFAFAVLRTSCRSLKRF